MKRILAFCLTLMFSVCLSGNLVYASINNNTLTEENLNNYSIEQLLEYAREQGINYTIIDYKLIDKSELIDVILALTSTPEIVEEEIVYTDKNSMDTLGLGESYEYNVIMDGRDIGTVVLKNSKFKFFLTASPEERARRG